MEGCPVAGSPAISNLCLWRPLVDLPGPAAPRGREERSGAGGPRSLQEGMQSGFCFFPQPLQLSRGSGFTSTGVLQPQGAASKTLPGPKSRKEEQGQGYSPTFQATCHSGSSSFTSKLPGVPLGLLLQDKSRLSSLCPDPTTPDWMLQVGPSGGSLHTGPRKSQTRCQAVRFTPSQGPHWPRPPPPPCPLGIHPVRSRF